MNTRNERVRRFSEELAGDAARGEIAEIASYQRRFPGIEDTVRTMVSAARRAAGRTFEDHTEWLSPLLPARMRPRDDSPAAPDAIGRYRLVRLLARGGQGVVYLAEDSDLARPVVIKTLRSSMPDPQGRERLRREARLCGRIDHPAVCPILDVLAVGETDYVIMPFIEGETLESRMRRGEPQNSVSVAALMEAIAAAVHHAHERGVVHRDLKPGNVMMKPDGSPIILDFGLAIEEAATSGLTDPGTAVGTPAYMAPEQIDRDVAPIGRHTDVYALGIMLFELLTGRVPFEGRSVHDVFRRILAGSPPVLRRIAPALSRDLAAVCTKAMSVDPGDRYATASDLADDLGNVRSMRPTNARPTSLAGRSWRRVRRHPRIATVGAVALVLLGVAIHTTYRAIIERQNREILSDAMDVLGATRGPEAPATPRSFRDHLSRADYGPFLEDPFDPAALARLRRAVNHRTPDRPYVDDRLLMPRATVASETPAFRLRVPGDSVEQRAVFVVIIEGPERSWRLRVPAVRGNTRRTGGFTVLCHRPRGLRLPIGVDLRWRTELQGETRQVYGPPGVGFRIMDPQSRAGLLTGMPTSGRIATDRNLRAAKLISAGLAADAIAHLADFPDDARVDERIRRHWLEARAHSLLEDAQAVEAALDRLRTVRQEPR